MSERDQRVRRAERARSLKTAGVMIATFCGLCTTTCAGPTAWNVARGENHDYMAAFVLQLAALIGLLPMFVGVGLYLVGRHMQRPSR